MSELLTRAGFGQFGGRPADISLAQFGVQQPFLGGDTTGGLGLPQVGLPPTGSPTPLLTLGLPEANPKLPNLFPFGTPRFEGMAAGGFGSLSPAELSALTRGRTAFR